MTDYLTCDIVFNKTTNKVWIGQPHLVKKMEEKSKDMVKSFKTYKTPGTPNQSITRGSNGGKLNFCEEAEIVLIQIYDVILSFKTFTPIWCKFSVQVFYSSGWHFPAAFNEILCVIKFVLDTKN